MVDRLGSLSRLCAILLAAGTILSLQPASAQVMDSDFRIVSVPVQFVPEAERKPVPLELAYNLLFFKLRVDGQDVWAMLDNGSDVTILDSGLAKARGIAVSGPVVEGRTPTGTFSMQRAPGVPIEIPGQLSFRPPVMVADLSPVAKMAGLPIAMIIGGDTFASLSFFISPSTRTFLVSGSGMLNAPPNTPFIELKNDKPQVDILLDGKPAVVTVDLGSSNNVALSEAAWNRLGLQGRAATAGESRSFEGGAAPTRTTIVRRLEVGPLVAPDANVSSQAMLPAWGDGTIGMSFFAATNFLIDVKARRIWLVSPVGATPVEFEAAAQSAVRLYKAGMTREAGRQLSELRAKARSHEDLNNLCWAKATAGILLESAVQDCTEAVKQGGGAATYLDSLGMALMQSGKLPQALAAYSQAIDKAQPAPSYFGRALVHARMGNSALAQADLADARKRDPGVEKAYADLGFTLSGGPGQPRPQ